MFEIQGGRHKLRWLMLLSGLVENLFFTGIVYGWASLVFALKADGYFAGYCVNITREEDNAVFIDCSGQDEHFSRVMSVASISNTIIRFPTGYIFDRCGTAATRLIAISLYTTGTLFITLSNTETSLLLYPALSCILMAGTILYITNSQVGNLFDSYRSTVITLYNGAYDSSAVVFLIIKLLRERGVSLQSSFLFVTLCNIIHLLRTIFLMPRGHIPYPLPETFTYGFQSCVLSWLFLWHVVWVVTIIFCHIIFLTNVNPVLTRLANDDQTLVSHYTNVYALTQLCGVFMAPLNGLIMDRHKGKPLDPGKTLREADLHSSSLALFLTSLQCFLLCVCFTCPILPLQYVTFVLQVLNSGFFYGGHHTFISIAFPMSHFGKMSGVAMSFAALALLLQLPVLHLIQHQLHGDPLYVNVGVTVLSLLAFTHPVHVSLYCTKLAKQRKTEQEVDKQGSAMLTLSGVTNVENENERIV
ncbi:equilibrative nucleobase transporter 1-like [Pagrus major]|uniref:equilibrative nucleobase transporter 1-like n=1 Tax=Pagrus major TaxID=143350 RepID=UPI003CC85BED